MKLLGFFSRYVYLRELINRVISHTSWWDTHRWMLFAHGFSSRYTKQFCLSFARWQFTRTWFFQSLCYLLSTRINTYVSPPALFFHRSTHILSHCFFIRHTFYRVVLPSHILFLVIHAWLCSVCFGGSLCLCFSSRINKLRIITFLFIIPFDSLLDVRKKTNAYIYTT